MARLLLLRWLLLVAVCLLSALVSGFMPPHQSSLELDSNGSTFSSWETVGAMRRRLGVSYNYTPDLLNPEMCRYLSEDECRDANDSMQTHARQMRKLPKLARQRRLQQQQPLTDNTADGRNGHQERRQLNPDVGVVKVLVVLIQFQDHQNRTLLDPLVYNEMWNSNTKSDLIPSGSIARWFQLNSYGLYEIEAVIVPWTISDNTELYYSFGSSGLVTDFQRAFWPALDRLDQEGINWSDYDIDGDGKLDAVVALHTGYSAELKGVDCNSKRDFSNRIWSHAFASSFNSWTSRDGAYQVGGYVVASAYKDICGSEPANIGTMTHEFMHTMGLVDLYDGQDARVGRGVGGFDIMATPYGPKDDSSWPGHLSAWSRIEVGWLLPIDIVQDGEYSIQASELSNQAYVIRKPYPFMEYLLIENRQPLWFDARLWTGGLVIYHIDDRAPLQMNRGYPGQEGWPRNGNHYQVAVLASDGQYNLEKGDNVGDVGDFWKEGMTLGPGNGRVFPNTDAYQFGSIRVTGVTISDIRRVDTVMTFRVSGLSDTPAPVPMPLPTTTVSPSVQGSQGSQGSSSPVEWVFTDELDETATSQDETEADGLTDSNSASSSALTGTTSGCFVLSIIASVISLTAIALQL